MLDGVTVFTLPASRITESWSHCTSPPLAVAAGAHTFAFILGEGGMDLLDNVVIKRVTGSARPGRRFRSIAEGRASARLG